MLVECSRVSLISGRILSGNHSFESETAKVSLLEWADDGYLLLVEHNNGATERVWIEGDLPKSLYIHDPLGVRDHPFSSGNHA